jgi:hypothetical protein
LNDKEIKIMTLFKQDSFQPDLVPRPDPIPNGQDIPKDEDIFFRDETDFLPEGKKFEDLTEQEKKDLKNKYRFDPMRPGIYQGITGMNNMV